MIEKEITNLIHKIIREDLILDGEIIHTSIEKLDLNEK